MDFTKLPNSAPRASRGTWRSPRVSMAMPSRPMRLAATEPSMRCIRSDSTSLNTPHLSLRDLAQPTFECDHLRIDARRDRIELGAHVGVAGIAREDVFVDVPRFFDQTLADVEIGHGHGVRRIFARRF